MTTTPRDPRDEELRRLLAVEKSRAVRSLGFDFLRWVGDETELSILAGDENWDAIDISHHQTVLARVFPKKAGLVKVTNRASASEDYGRYASLNEWVFDLDSTVRAGTAGALPLRPNRQLKFRSSAVSDFAIVPL
jgi:hypothetical protein